MESRTFPRATEPHRATLAASLLPVIGPHFLRYDKGTLFIEADFGVVTSQAVQALVDAAPQATKTLDVRGQVDALPVLLKAIVLALVDGLNIERQQHGRAAITPAVILAAIKAKVDEIG